MTNFNKSALVAIAAAAMAPSVLAHAGDAGPTRWLGAWRYAPIAHTETNAVPDAWAALHAADTSPGAQISIRQEIPGTNCGAETVSLAIAKPIAFRACHAPTPRSWVALNPTSASNNTGAPPAGVPVG